MRNIRGHMQVYIGLEIVYTALMAIHVIQNPVPTPNRWRTFLA
jgi:hypothetical protein